MDISFSGFYTMALLEVFYIGYYYDWQVGIKVRESHPIQQPT